MMPSKKSSDNLTDTIIYHPKTLKTTLHPPKNKYNYPQRVWKTHEYKYMLMLYTACSFQC